MAAAKSKGGKRPGAGRKKGVPNKRTQERQREFAASGKADPLQSQLALHEWALGEFAKACRALAEYEQKHATLLERARLHLDDSDKAKSVLAGRVRLAADVDAFATKVHAYAMGATPFLHPRLAATEAKIDMTTHEAALDELDDEAPENDGARA